MDSGSGDLLSQIWELMLFVLVLAFMWFGSLFFIMRRSKERRRREAEGLEPLPPIWEGLRQWWEQRQQAMAASAPLSPARSENYYDSAGGVLAQAMNIPLPTIAALVRPLDGSPALPPQEVLHGTITYSPSPPPPVARSPEPPAPPSLKAFDLQDNQLPDDAVELLRVWRDIASGALIVGVEDQLFTAPDQLEDDRLLRRFQTLMHDLNRLAQLSTSSPPSPAPAPDAGASRGAKTRQQAPPALSIIAQIEAFLQSRLQEMPHLAQRSIHMREADNGELLIEVDGAFYEAIGDVEDASVRQALQKTIQEWESTH